MVSRDCRNLDWKLKEVKNQCCLLRDGRTKCSCIRWGIWNTTYLKSQLEYGLKTQSKLRRNRHLLIQHAALSAPVYSVVSANAQAFGAASNVIYDPLRMTSTFSVPMTTIGDWMPLLYLFQIFCHFHLNSHMPLSDNLPEAAMINISSPLIIGWFVESRRFHPQLVSIPPVPNFIAGWQPLKYLLGTSALLDILCF